ncbi:DUF4013 domain-containing protein [Halorubrum tibetense]|uniref:DUF4013 domain-containing protein n=1 Tax=Halorubrum tibetense TaxID=175631 RepID=A0ABD5S9H5_9EURY
MISASLGYLRDSDDGIKTTAIGGVLLLLSPLLIPVFLVLGYLMRVLRRTTDGVDEPPVFDDWGDLLVDGVKAFVVTFVYSVVPLVALAVVGVFGVGAVLIGGGDSALAGIVGGTLVVALTLVAFAVSIAGVYVTPAALSNYAGTGRVSDGFALATIWTVITKKAYAVGWLYAFAVILAGSLAIGVLSVVPVLGTIAGVFVQFYAVVAAYYIVGHTWADVRPVAAEQDGVGPVERPVV